MSLDRALALVDAAGPVGYPNPTVGAVLVADGAIVGEGVTEPYGGRHGEVVALAAAGDRARGATLFVTMEPCAHHGRTPPCVDAILAAGVARVVAGCLDPNPEAAGGLERLRAAGVEVELDDRFEARRQNEAWRTWKSLGRPFVVYKAAITLDGRVTVPGRRWVTGGGLATACPRASGLARCGRGGHGDGASGRAAARRAGCPRRAAAASARVRPRAAAAGLGARAALGEPRRGARRARSRGRAVDPARGRADARDRVPRGRARRQAARLRGAAALG